MKTKLLFLSVLLNYFLCSCDLLGGDDDSVDGEQSPMGEVGATVSSGSVAGVEGATATVTSVNNGISTFSGEATVTNAAILNAVSNIPEFTVNGNQISVTGLEFKVTKEGVESKVSSYPGVIVKYDAKVGDKYSAGSGYEREVISRSSDDDYPYVFFNIKVIKVEESPCSLPGVKKMVYAANHRFGIVGLEVTFDDNSTTNFTLMGSAEND